MATGHGKIAFHHEGIGKTIRNERFVVPLNQREYSWDEEHVKVLFQDLNAAMLNGKPSYFLGTIVLTKQEDGKLEVVDGQQRLATTTIFLGAVRDYFWNNDQRARADQIKRDYLLNTDLETEALVPRLALNVDDNQFFLSGILPDPNDPRRATEPTRDSHKRLKAASAFAAKYIEEIVAPHAGKAKIDALVKWVKFLDEDVEVVRVTAPDHLDAFVMFETLNDRVPQNARSETR